MALFGREREAARETLAELKAAIARADIPAANAAIAKLGKLEDAGLDLLGDLDAAVEPIPEDWKKLVAALLAVAQKGVDATGHYGALAQKVIEIVTGLRDGRWVEAQGIKFGPDGISGRVRIAPK